MTEPLPDTYPSGLPRPPRDALLVPAEVLVVTGMSGAGRTRAAASLADLGWYVVDNLPPQMLAEMVAMVVNGNRSKVAAVVDVRGGDLFGDLDAVLEDVAATGAKLRVLFLDASDDALVRRFEEARRPHPLQGADTILEGIARERIAVSAARERADLVIDTSVLSVYDLRDAVVAFAGGEAAPLRVTVESFGFKGGSPRDADFVVDVRFIPNPHWVPELRPLSGLDAPVREYVLGTEGAMAFIDGYAAVLDGALGRFRSHDKPHVTIAVGCTGGRHRSVAMAEALTIALRDRGYQVRAFHRDLEAER